jgi:hypothetical protein
VNLLLVSYDVKAPGRDYTALYDAIKASPGWWHYLESTWIVATAESVGVFSERLSSAIDQNDRLLVVDIKGKEVNGWLPAKAWEWLQQNGAN